MAASEEVMTLGNRAGITIASEQLRRNLIMLSGLRLDARQAFEALLLRWAWQGFCEVVVIDTSRSLEEQQRLYGIGRSEQECKLAGVSAFYAHPSLPQVTWCKPEDSGHVQRRAADIDWSHYPPKAFAPALSIARALGFTCGADWKKRDLYHFEKGGEEH